MSSLWCYNLSNNHWCSIAEQTVSVCAYTVGISLQINICIWNTCVVQIHEKYITINNILGLMFTYYVLCILILTVICFFNHLELVFQMYWFKGIYYLVIKVWFIYILETGWVSSVVSWHFLRLPFCSSKSQTILKLLCHLYECFHIVAMRKIYRIGHHFNSVLH